MSNIGITRMISDLFFGSSRERVKNNGRQMMSKKLIALTIVALIGFSLCSIALAKKPPPPPPPPDADPAIAYVLGGDVWVMNADGSNNTLVRRGAGNPYNLRLFWSPDGDRLAFRGYWPDSPSGIVTMNLDGSDLFYVTQILEHFEWSPGDVLGQGDKMIFSASDDLAIGNLPYDIFMINPDGTGLVKLADTPDLCEYEVAWSPDSDGIAVQVIHTSDGDHLYVYKLAEDEETGNIYVTDMVNVNEMAADYGVEYPTDFGGLDWANTQNKVVTGVRRTDGFASDIWTLDLGPPYHMQRITGERCEADFPVGAYVMYSAWSPDDNRIAFAVNGSGKYKKYRGIYVVDAATGENMEKLEDGACSEPEWYRYAE